MPDIFLSYASQDGEKAKTLYDLLEPLWDVAWDHSVVGNFSNWLEITIPKSLCLVALLSPESRAKETVLDEIRIAKENNTPVIPVIIRECSPPYGCGLDMRVDMRAWNGDPQHFGYLNLVSKITSIVEPKSSPMRLNQMNNGRLPLPCFFPSISRYETQFKPIDAFRVASQSPCLLVSAYDTECDAELRRRMGEYRSNGGFILLDSGGYEAGRLKDKEWCSKRLWDSWSCTPHDLAFGFDNPSLTDASLSGAANEPERLSELLVEAVLRDREQSRSSDRSTVIPIVHIPRPPLQEKDEYKHELAPEILLSIAKRLEPTLIAIPERELGSGINQRAKTILHIRKRLNDLPFYQPIHILGTGYPWAIALFSACGADSFDGLEWCRYVVDHKTGMLQHFHHLDFFIHQSDRHEPIDGLEPHIALAAACIKDDTCDYRVKVATHNLSYYHDFFIDLRGRLETGNIAAILRELFNKENRKELEKDMPELFS